jgi:alpha-1,3-rhamnosyl/mannosyltransferase
MRIGIDLRPLQAETKHRGIGKSLEFFLEAAAPLLSSEKLVFYIDQHIDQPSILSLYPKARLIFFNSLAFTRKKYIRSIVTPWRALEVNAKDIDVLLQYDVALGIPKNIPTVTVFHDLIPYLFHEHEKALIRQVPFRRSIKNRLANAAYWQQYLRIIKRYQNAAAIIAISKASKQDYISHFNPDKKQRISIIPHGVNESFFSLPVTPLSPDLSRQITKRYFIYVGGIDYRKNISRLLEDFFTFRKTHDAQLVLIGKEFALQEQLDDLGWQAIIEKYGDKYISDVIRPGYISHDDLISLLHNADAMLFPSLYEGFGMPPLEAMAAGCPVVTYDNSSLGEVVGDSGVLLENGSSLIPAMEDIMLHPAKYHRLAKKAQTRARSFSWETTASNIIKELRRYAS